jgi:hypothetical protein
LIGGNFVRQASAAAIPTIDVTGVVKDTSVSIKTSNFPANTKFDVRMGKFGTMGVNGIKVTTIDSGGGGAFSSTFSIPADLKGESLIAIRLESASGYFSYNWFQNTTYGTTSGTPVATTSPQATATATATAKPGSTAAPTATPKATVSAVVPSFTITGVVKDDTVSIKTSNFPKNMKFDVLMGKMWTAGVNGTKVNTIDSGEGGSFTATFSIPAELKGLDRISIRLQSASGPFAYNWFWNNN